MGISSIGISSVGISSINLDVIENIATIARNTDILIYGVIPVYTAIFIAWQLCKWFKNTFVL